MKNYTIAVAGTGYVGLSIATLLVIDIVALTISFMLSLSIRYSLLVKNLGSVRVMSTYELFFAIVLIMYIIVSSLRRRIAVEKMSIRAYCLKKGEQIPENYEEIVGLKAVASDDEKAIRHVYIIGAKSIGLYGGYESFILNLLQQHKDNKNIKYHVACKANGDGYMDLEKLPGAIMINRNEFSYCNAHCFMIHVPEKIGPAQAIYYDINALRWCCEHIEKNHIKKPIVYILASRIGPFEKRYVKRIHMANGLVYQNPDGGKDIIWLNQKTSHKYSVLPA